MPYHSGIAKHVGIYYDFIYAVASFFIRFGMLAGGTFVYWFWYLARSPAYKPAKAGALLMLFGAWYVRAHIVYHWMIVCKVCLVPVAVALSTYVANGVRFTQQKGKENWAGRDDDGRLLRRINPKALGTVALCVGALAYVLFSRRESLCRYATNAQIRRGACVPGKVWNPLQGENGDGPFYVNVSVLAFMVGTAIFNPIPEKAADKGRGVAGFLTPFSLGVFGWVLALMTEQPWLLFYSVGYLASLMQGVSHTLTRETPTLPRLRNVRDEYAHTTYFPCLVLQSMIQTADAEKKKGDATKGKKD